MEIGQIEAFLAVVREGSFTKAAERLNLRQPSLSARIQALEQTLGGDLFLRDKRPVQLSPIGEIFVDYAERAMGVLEAGSEAVRAARLGTSGRVTVCCPFSLATYLMPNVVTRFSQQYPQAELFVEAGHSDYAVRQLVDGLVNFALAAAFPRYASQTHALLRLHDEMVVAAAPGHPAARATALTLDEVWGYQKLVIHWGRTFDAYLSSLQQMAAQHSAASGPTIRVPLAAALAMARQPNTITFLPRRLTAVANLIELPVPQFTFDWDAVLLTRPGRPLSVLEQAFVALVAEVWES
jgi:DNA-binding transcriptional LysR family regulator